VLASHLAYLTRNACSSPSSTGWPRTTGPRSAGAASAGRGHLRM